LHVEVHFWTRAISDERSRAQHLLSHDRSLTLLTRLVQEAIDAGEIDPGLDPRRVAEGLLAFIDGLGVDALMHPQRVSPARQRALLKDQLSRIAAPGARLVTHRPGRARRTAAPTAPAAG
jgi:hypothetical protein